MKCPQCSEKKGKKPVELQTKRTLADGRSVSRERVCPKCAGRWWTEERYRADILADASAREDERRKMDAGVVALHGELERFRSFFRDLKALVPK